jgi:hypothetical protein
MRLPAGRRVSARPVHDYLAFRWQVQSGRTAGYLK